MSRIDLNGSIRQYLAEVQRVLGELPEQQIARLIALLLEANRERRQVFLLGNGGSASTASHLACDLGKGAIAPGSPRFKVIALTDNVPLMTAWANDTAYENIFAQQLAGLVEARDVVIGISGSGNSANVLNAMRLAREHAATTVALTGFDGGQLKELVDLCVLVPSSCMEQIEDAHLTLAHLICTCIRETLWETAVPSMLHADSAAGADESTLHELVERLTLSLRVSVSSVLLCDGPDAEMVIRATKPIRDLKGVPPVGRRIPHGEVPTHERIIREGRPVLYSQHEPRLAIPPEELELTLTSGLKSGALLPLKINGCVRGVVSLGEARAWDRDPFTEEKLNQGLSIIHEWARARTSGHGPLVTAGAP